MALPLRLQYWATIDPLPRQAGFTSEDGNDANAFANAIESTLADPSSNGATNIAQALSSATSLLLLTNDFVGERD
jgi:hypothetical protein